MSRRRLLPLILASVLCSTVARAADGDFLRVSMPSVPDDLLLDLVRSTVWLGDICMRSLPLAKVERGAGELRVVVAERVEADPAARLPAAEFRIVLALAGKRGSATISSSLAAAPLKLAVSVSPLASAPCR